MKLTVLRFILFAKGGRLTLDGGCIAIPVGDTFAVRLALVVGVCARGILFALVDHLVAGVAILRVGALGSGHSQDAEKSGSFHYDA